MTIEHSLIPQGEQHVTANWVTSSVAALANIAGIGFDDIGKQAWVQGKGHYVLANSDPLIWERVSPTVATVSFVEGTDVLTITLTDATSFTVTVPLGTTEAEANALIAAALTDYYTAAQVDTIVSGIGTALSGKEPTIAAGTTAQYWRGDKTWQTLDAAAVAETDSRVYLSPAQKTVATQAATSLLNGYLSSADWTTFNSKQAALANVITAGTYGSSTQYAIPTFNAKGICTGVTLQTIGAPVLTEANFSVAKTGQPTYTVSWVLTALTDARAWTVPDKPINFGDLPSVATTNGNTLSNPTTGNSILGAQNSTVGGTGNVLIGAPYFGVGLNSMLGSGNVLINAVKTSLPSDSIFCVVINNYNYSGILSEINSNEVIAIQNKGLRIGTTTSLGAFFYGCINRYNASISYNIAYSQFWYCSDLEFRNNPSKLFFSANFPAYSIVRGMVSNVENSGDETVGTTVQSIVSATGILGSKILVAPHTGGADNRHAVAYKNTGIAVHTITATFSDTATNSGAVRVRRITVDKTGAVVDTQTIGTDFAYGTTTFTMNIVITTVITITATASTGNTGRATATINSQFT